MATVFTIMAYGGMALAVICLVFAIILFVKWDIPKVFGDISGRTEKKTIEKIRKEGYEANASKQTSIKASTDTGKIRVRQTNTDALIGGRNGASGKIAGRSNGTTEVNKNINRESAVTKEDVTNTVFHVYQSEEFNPEEETTVLNQAAPNEEETTVLSQASEEEETSVLSQTPEEEETSVLSQPPEEEETSVLSQPPEIEETSVLSQTPKEEETTVLNQTSEEEGTTVLSNKTKDTGGEDMHPSEESTTILAESNVAGVIQLPNEIFTQPGTVAKVLDFIITHTDDEIS